MNHLGVSFCLLKLAWLTACVGCLPSNSPSILTSGVGSVAVLPCTLSRYSQALDLDLDDNPYVMWEIGTEPVCERMGEVQFQANAYSGRADLDEEKLKAGNCSLHLRDVRFSDAGVYESYLLAGKTTHKYKYLVQSVKFSVYDHKFTKIVEKGEDLTLDLYSDQATSVIFQSDQNPTWNVLWDKRWQVVGEKQAEKRENTVVLTKMQPHNAGIYKVMDPEGLALSTVKVSVKERAPQLETTFYSLKQVALEKDGGRMNTVSSQIIFLLLLCHCLFYLL